MFYPGDPVDERKRQLIKRLSGRQSGGGLRVGRAPGFFGQGQRIGAMSGLAGKLGGYGGGFVNIPPPQAPPPMAPMAPQQQFAPHYQGNDNPEPPASIFQPPSMPPQQNQSIFNNPLLMNLLQQYGGRGGSMRAV